MVAIHEHLAACEMNEAACAQGLRSATFEVVYLDNDIRITRGDRGELRIYAKDDTD